MTSAWGDSWGTAWGDSWGAVSVVTPIPPEQPHPGGGKKKRKKHKIETAFRQQPPPLTPISIFNLPQPETPEVKAEPEFTGHPFPLRPAPILVRPLGVVDDVRSALAVAGLKAALVEQRKRIAQEASYDMNLRLLLLLAT